MSIAEKNKVLSANNVTIAENEQRVYDSGYSQAERAFWEGFTGKGRRQQYMRAFQQTDFSGATFPSGVVINTCNRMFYDYSGNELIKGIDLSKLGSYLESTYDETADAASTFAWAGNITTIYDMKLPAPKAYITTFSNMRSLTTIEMPIKVRDDTTFTRVLANSPKIAELRFEGVIGQNGLDVSSCTLLSHDSLMSIINCLKDYSAIGGTYTVTLGAANIAKLTEEEQAIATSKGWVLA